MVPQVGIEPTHPDYKTGPLPLRILGLMLLYFSLPSATTKSKITNIITKGIQSGDRTHNQLQVITLVSFRYINSKAKRPGKPIDTDELFFIFLFQTKFAGAPRRTRTGTPKREILSLLRLPISPEGLSYLLCMKCNIKTNVTHKK